VIEILSVVFQIVGVIALGLLALFVFRTGIVRSIRLSACFLWALAFAIEHLEAQFVALAKAPVERRPA
jgi:hypothetical protein